MRALTLIEIRLHQPEDPHSNALLAGLSRELGRADPIQPDPSGQVHVHVVFDDPLAGVTDALDRVDSGWRNYLQVSVAQ